MVTISAHSLSRWHAGVQMSSSHLTHCHHSSLSALFRSRLQDCVLVKMSWKQSLVICSVLQRRCLVSIRRFLSKIICTYGVWRWNILCLLRGIIFRCWWWAKACYIWKPFSKPTIRASFLPGPLNPIFAAAIHRPNFLKNNQIAQTLLPDSPTLMAPSYFSGLMPHAYL